MWGNETLLLRQEGHQMEIAIDPLKVLIDSFIHTFNVGERTKLFRNVLTFVSKSRNYTYFFLILFTASLQYMNCSLFQLFHFLQVMCVIQVRRRNHISER